MQIHKILQYNFLQLVNLAVFRLIYKIRLTCRKLYVLCIKPQYNYIVRNNIAQKYDSIDGIFSEYYRFCNSDKETIRNNANKIISGKIYLFERWFDFNYEKDWLKCPITGNEWDRFVYCNDAQFKDKKCADVKYVLETNKLNPLVTVALAYYYTKQEKYVDFILKAIRGWMKCVPMERSVANRIVMDIGYRSINLIHISLLCKDSTKFKELVHPIIIGLLHHHERFIWSRLSSRWFKSQNDNNHNVGEIVGLYVCQLWLDFFEDRHFYHSQKKQIKYLQKVLNKIILPDGTYIEQSGNYTKVVAEFLMLYEIFRRAFNKEKDNFKKDIDVSDYLFRITNYLYQISYNGKILNFGDNDDALVLIPFEKSNGDCMHLLAYCNIPQEYKSLDNECQWIYHSKDSNEVMIFSRIGKFAYYVEGAYIHAHNDMLSILLAIRGSELFIDKGCYFYNSGINIRKEYASTLAHNTICINMTEMSDFLQSGYKNYPSSHIYRSIQEGDNCQMESELSYKNIKHNRSIKYDSFSITIVDLVSCESGYNNTGKITYVISDKISPIATDSNSVLCEDKEKGNLFRIEFKGISKLLIQETNYAPSYGNIKKTHILIGDFDFAYKTEIQTIITF